MANSLPEDTQNLINSTNEGGTTARIVIKLQPRGVDKTIIFNAGEDYTENTLKIVKSYATETIREGGSSYKISSDLDAEPISLTNDGLPSAISDDAPGGDGNAFIQKATVGQGSRGGKSYFVRLSDNSFNGTNVVKGKTNPGPEQYVYDDLLAEVNLDNNENNTLGNNTARSQARFNSFSANEEYIPTIGLPETDSNVGKVKYQNSIGTYQRYKTNLNQTNFQNIGNQITLKSTGEYYVPKFGEQQTDDNTGGEIALARAASLAPGLVRLGLKIPMSELNVETVLNDLLKPDFQFNQTNNFPDLKEETQNTYGSYNNWIAPFDGIDTISQIPALAILVLTLGTLVQATAEILETISGDSNYSLKVRAGFISFFGLQTPGQQYDIGSFFVGLSTAILSSRLINETGWYSTVIRSIVKNIFQELSRGTFAVASIGSISNQFGSQIPGSLNRTGLDIYSSGGDGIQDPFTNTIKIIETFLTSKWFKFVAMLSTIGDNVLNPTNTLNSLNKATIIRSKVKGIDSAPRANASLTANQKSYANEIGSNLNTRVINDRISATNSTEHINFTIGNKPIAWGVGTTPSMYLLPNSIKKAAYMVKGISGLNDISTFLNLDVRDAIEPDHVTELEQRLNSSYMPFYIQDMRTNEIISFHAFVESMLDSFSSEYDSQTGFGRVEPTHIYKNSKRQMSMDFWIVSTNPDDHDEMWWKINKILTFIYPQYTKGRQLETFESEEANRKKFVQPFSQLVGSSPLIRLRVGDVWKTNYSSFNLMRKFGLSTGDFKLDSSFEDLNTTQISKNENYRNTIRRMLTQELEANDQIVLDYSPEIDNRVFGLYNVPDPVSTPKNLVKPDLLPGIYKFKIENKNSTKFNLLNEFKLKRLDDNDGIVGSDTYYYRCPKINAFSITELNYGDLFGEALLGKFKLIDSAPTEEIWQKSVAYSARSVSVTPDYNWLSTNHSGYDNPNVASITTINGKISEFFKIDDRSETNNNPIMQSFKKNQGQGIAGFISAVKVDWSDAPWETNINSSRNSSRAPLWCKINIEFLPIHDITPGIDSDGFMTAPVYPVGRYSNATSNIRPITPSGTPEGSGT